MLAISPSFHRERPVLPHRHLFVHEMHPIQLLEPRTGTAWNVESSASEFTTVQNDVRTQNQDGGNHKEVRHSATHSTTTSPDSRQAGSWEGHITRRETASSHTPTLGPTEVGTGAWRDMESHPTTPQHLREGGTHETRPCTFFSFSITVDAKGYEFKDLVWTTVCFVSHEIAKAFRYIAFKFLTIHRLFSLCFVDIPAAGSAQVADEALFAPALPILFTHEMGLISSFWGLGPVSMLLSSNKYDRTCM